MTLCSLVGCAAKHHARQLCRAHYDQKYRGTGLTDFAAKVKRNKALLAEGRKFCSYCKKSKKVESFPPCSGGQGGVKSYCRDCHYSRRTEAKRQQDLRRYKKARDDAAARYVGGGDCPPHIRVADRAASKLAREALNEKAGRFLAFALQNWASEDKFRASLARSIFSALSQSSGRSIGPWSAPGLSGAERYRLRYRYDKDFAISERLRRQITKAQKKLGTRDCMVSALKRDGSSPKVERDFGYTVGALRVHLEKQFIGRMSWAHFLAGDIHIDHIIPMVEFDLENEAEYQKCWCLSNLRPVWAGENLRKGARREFLV